MPTQLVGSSSSKTPPAPPACSGVHNGDDHPPSTLTVTTTTNLNNDTHLNATKGYIQVPALNTNSLAKHGMAGALGLCGVVVSLNKSLSNVMKLIFYSSSTD
ncbi:hypothetical protein V8B97DRAFT_1913451 [Scleroderma yunnanense]